MDWTWTDVRLTLMLFAIFELKLGIFLNRTWIPGWPYQWTGVKINCFKANCLIKVRKTIST